MNISSVFLILIIAMSNYLTGRTQFIALPDKAPEGMTQFDDIKGSDNHISTMFSLLGIKKPTQGVPA